MLLQPQAPLSVLQSHPHPSNLRASYPQASHPAPAPNQPSTPSRNPTRTAAMIMRGLLAGCEGSSPGCQRGAFRGPASPSAARARRVDAEEGGPGADHDGGPAQQQQREVPQPAPPTRHDTDAAQDKRREEDIGARGGDSRVGCWDWRGLCDRRGLRPAEEAHVAPEDTRVEEAREHKRLPRHATSAHPPRWLRTTRHAPSSPSNANSSVPLEFTMRCWVCVSIVWRGEVGWRP